MKIFVINPGSTSTKLAVYENGEPMASREFQHDRDELIRLGSVVGQREFRMAAIRKIIAESEHDLTAIDAVAGRGGLLHPLGGRCLCRVGRYARRSGISTLRRTRLQPRSHARAGSG
ncbi:hypothetical protein [uncultured Pseudodesulfovibrio sp.]|uniref:hypothetical protein n=1 Tax=uncultured Pseudodesulfovibrio sp. TaxID=2035858 RepID=UPI0029C82402|nr:hypothetical protein [uncultured Pseudodesulfovibrio sp.]